MIFHSIRLAAGFICLIPHYSGFIIGRFLMAFGATAANLSAYIISMKSNIVMTLFRIISTTAWIRIYVKMLLRETIK